MSRAGARPLRGFTLTELLVTIVIASLLGIAVASVLGGFEGRRRSGSAVNDINQAGNYAAWVLDGMLRSAGSGFVQTAAFGFGCELRAAKSNATILPAQAALAAPFAALGRSFRLAPALIVQDGTNPDDSGAGSDALVVMSGAAGDGEVPAYLDGFAASAALPLKNTVSFAANDLLLLINSQLAASGPAPCMLSQVSSSFVPQAGAASLDLAGAYYQTIIAGRNLTDYGNDAMALNLGSVARGNPPSFMLVGVGNNSTLYAYDLMQTSDTPLQALASGVFGLRARYGLDTSGNGRLDRWMAPSGDYSYAALTDGSSAAAQKIAQIKSIRVGLILRTALREKADVSPATITLFSELGTDLEYSLSLAGDNTKYRYRTVEFTVPLRNAMMLE